MSGHASFAPIGNNNPQPIINTDVNFGVNAAEHNDAIADVPQNRDNEPPRAAHLIGQLDILTGQGDRHNDNYLVDIDKDTLEVTIKGIDNDASYGVLRTGLKKFFFPAGSAAQRWFSKFTWTTPAKINLKRIAIQTATCCTVDKMEDLDRGYPIEFVSSFSDADLDEMVF